MWTEPSAVYSVQISYFPADVGGSLVQLNTTDCQWKVGCDLIQLFVFRPTADLSLPVAGLEALYAEYFSRRLRTAVYAAKDIKWLLKAKHVQKVIEVCIQASHPAVCKFIIIIEHADFYGVLWCVVCLFW